MLPLDEVCFATRPRDKKRLASAISLPGWYRFAQASRAAPPLRGERRAGRLVSQRSCEKSALIKSFTSPDLATHGLQILAVTMTDALRIAKIPMSESIQRTV
jgi:hypothetical protein